MPKVQTTVQIDCVFKTITTVEHLSYVSKLLIEAACDICIYRCHKPLSPCGVYTYFEPRVCRHRSSA
eukprot:COSAG01_NODE_289_length_19391_cov_119.323122_13_plen_67_part_00